VFSPELTSVIRGFQTEPRVPIAALAERLGLSVWTSALPRGISGKLTKDPTHGGKSGFAIFVNESEPVHRRRFTVAHEVGHFLLHRHLLDEGAIVDDAFYRSRLSNRLEAEANRAAAEILMPWHLINKETAVGVVETDQLADKFGVSETAMKIRLGIPT